MMMPTSLEFVALCRSQINLLTQGLGATFSVVYLMQQLGEGAESQLVPIIAYPESAIGWQDPLLQIPSTDTLFPTSSFRLLPALEVMVEPESLRRLLSPSGTPLSSTSVLPGSTSPADAPADSIATQRQIVLPLVQENVMLGLLVVGREDRGWSGREQAQIDQIARTLAIACVLDQRYQWLESDRQQERQIQSQQHDRLDNLLHQFRNSLTALQTFGKLILKRLQPDDRNREAASSLVRETIRLRELAQQLEAAAGGKVPSPLALPATSDESQQIAASVQPPVLPLLTGSLAEKPLTLTPSSLQAVLAPLLSSAETIAQDRYLSLHTLIPEKLPLVWTEPHALREVLNNLIENALKYTPSGGHILVQVSVSDSGAETPEEKSNLWLELTISDTGPGIPAQDLPHIFERRFRGVQAGTDIPGTGLGLAIAKSLVAQMHGAIEIQSPAQIWETFGAKTAMGTSLKLRLPIVSKDRHEIENLTT